MSEYKVCLNKRMCNETYLNDIPEGSYFELTEPWGIYPKGTLLTLIYNRTMVLISNPANTWPAPPNIPVRVLTKGEYITIVV